MESDDVSRGNWKNQFNDMRSCGAGEGSIFLDTLGQDLGSSLHESSPNKDILSVVQRLMKSLADHSFLQASRIK